MHPVSNSGASNKAGQKIPEPDLPTSLLVVVDVGHDKKTVFLITLLIDHLYIIYSFSAVNGNSTRKQTAA
ncbi:hypothetical protein DJ62_3481 [Yersinia enterocolitica]|nr:hypothetical protein DJ62_3481 [Yersinia enterocolitica]